MSDSSNNELFIINLATVPGRRNPKTPPAQSRKTLAVMANEQELENMTSTNYEKNKPLVHSTLTGLFYLIFCWSLDLGEATSLPFMILMQFLPGLTFPLTTCYYKTFELTNKDINKLLHLILSVGIFSGSVWIFSGEGRIKFITILAGFLGSLFFMIVTKYLLKKKLNFFNIAIVAILSGLAFLPFELDKSYTVLLGLYIFLWTFINGLLLNFEYQKATYR